MEKFTRREAIGGGLLTVVGPAATLAVQGLVEAMFPKPQMVRLDDLIETNDKYQELMARERVACAGELKEQFLRHLTALRECMRDCR